MGSKKGDAVVRALASHQFDLGSNPGVDAICALGLLLVLSFAPIGFLRVLLFFPLLQNQRFQIPIRLRNQLEEEPLCVCATLHTHNPSKVKWSALN